MDRFNVRTLARLTYGKNEIKKTTHRSDEFDTIELADHNQLHMLWCAIELLPGGISSMVYNIIT